MKGFRSHGKASSCASNDRAAFTLIELLVVISILGLAISLLFAAIQRVRSTAARLHCLNNLRQLGLALHNYHGTHGRFPPGVETDDGGTSRPWLSWHARLLPYVEQEALWRQTEQAFAISRIPFRDPPHVAFSHTIPLFLCPADSRTVMMRDSLRLPKVGLTHYLGVLGKNAARCNGVLFADSMIRFADVLDGASQTLLVGERPTGPNLEYGWWYAGQGLNQNGAADMVLGVEERNRGTVPVQGCPLGPYFFSPGSSNEPCNVLQFWSLHSGGANFVFVDGSARFLGYGAKPIMPALASRSGGEVVVTEE